MARYGRAHVYAVLAGAEGLDRHARAGRPPGAQGLPAVEQFRAGVLEMTPERDDDAEISPLIGDPKRQATDSIRGYVYQIHQTVFYWLDLVQKPGSVIFVEAAEDFDVHSAECTSVNQVKDTKASGSITLANPLARAAIANFLTLADKNKQPFEYRYLTTSAIGREQVLEFPNGTPGIEYWKGVQKGDLLAKPLKDQLLRLDLPDNVKSWIEGTSDADFVALLVGRFHWCCEQPSLDAMIKIIEERLVIVGVKFGLLPRDSVKAYPWLLKHVAVTASTAPQGRLDLVTLVKLIQDAASIQVSASLVRQNATELTHDPPRLGASLTVVQPPGSLKGLLFREASVGSAVAAMRSSGVAVIVGPTGVGKSSAGYHSVEAICSTTNRSRFEFRHADLREAPPERISATVKAALAAAINSVEPLGFFFDDFNFESTGVDLFHLATLIEAVRMRGGFCMFTAYVAPSDSARAIMDVPEHSVIRPSSFDIEEVKQLALKHGLRNDDKLQAWGTAITLASSGGHPQFVHALVVSMARRHWPTSKLKSLFSDLNASEVSDAKKLARKKLIQTAPNSEVKALAYRLSVLIGDFSRSVALNVGAITPPIQNPGEALDILIGPWIEDKSSGRYAVSPLLSNAAADVNDEAGLHKLHHDIAESILKIKKIDAKDFQNAILHARIGKNTKAMLGAAMQLNYLLHQHPSYAPAFWMLPLLAEEEGKLYPPDETASCSLRTCQFLVAAVTEESGRAAVIGGKMMREITALQSEVRDPMFLTSSFYYLSKPKVPVEGSLSVDIIVEVRRIRSARSDLRDIFDRLEDPAKFSGPENFRLHHFLFASAIFKLSSVEEFLALLRRLDELPSHVRADVLYGLKMESTGGNLFVHRGWSSETKRKDPLDHQRCLEAYEEASTLFQKWNEPTLFKYATVCKSVLLDEYAGNVDEAIRVLSDVPDDMKQDVYLRHQEAKVLSRNKRHAEADAIWRKIHPDFDVLDPVDRAFACRHAAISASELENWDEAANYYAVAAKAAEEPSGPDTMRVGLLADKALAHFQNGDTAAALASLYEALKLLPDVPLTGDLRSHHVRATVAHAVAWVNTNILKSSDPRWAPSTKNELAFVPGMCSNQEPHADIVKQVLQPLSTTHLLLASSAAKVGLAPEIAEDYFAQNGQTAAPLVWLDYCHAIADRALLTLDANSLAAGIANFASAMLWYKSSEQTLAVAPIPLATGDAILHPGIEAALLDYSFAFLTLCVGRAQDVKEAARQLFDQFNEALPAVPLSLRAALDFDVETSRSRMEPLIYEWCRCLHQSADQLGSAEGVSYFLFRAVNYLTASSLRYAAGAEVARIAVARWTDILENQRYSLSSPNLHEPSIRDALASDETDPLRKVANIILVSAQAARLPLDGSAVDFLKSVRAGTLAKKSDS